MLLTKSLFVDYCDYPKLAWWKVNNPSIYKKIRKIESDDQEDHIMQIGQAVEDKVKELLELTHGAALDLMPRSFTNDDEEEVTITSDLAHSLSATLQAIRDHVPLLYQPTFQYGDCLIRADLMRRNGESYDLIEVKAKSGIRAPITDDGDKKAIGVIDKKILHDVSFQAYVINHVLAQHDLGQLSAYYIAYLNKEYIKIGPLDIQQLIIIDRIGVSKEIQVIQSHKPKTLVVDDSLLSDEEIETKLEEMRHYLPLSQEQADQEFLRTGNKYLHYFGEDKPFGTIMGMGMTAKASYIQELYYANKRAITDLTQADIDGFQPGAQTFIANYLASMSSGQPLIQRDQISQIFAGLQFPICFYDYETISVPIPMMDHTRPYMQTIVQYSLHKYYQDGRMEHYSAVYAGAGDKACADLIIDHPNVVEQEHERVIIGCYKDLLEQMIQDIGPDLHRSTFIVWHEGFENVRNKEVAGLFPDLAEAFLAINEHTYDLKKIVSEGYYFNPACCGSASIKKVLPVLVPHMSYKGMEIGKGDVAARALYELATDAIAPDRRDQTIINLLLYCGQDTLAMVRIYEALKALV